MVASKVEEMQVMLETLPEREMRKGLSSQVSHPCLPVTTPLVEASWQGSREESRTHLKAQR